MTKLSNQEMLPTVEMVVDAARPWWYKAARTAKHKTIADAAGMAGFLGPFPLLYADPPDQVRNTQREGARAFHPTGTIRL